MKKPQSELGTKEIHKRHSVMVEGGSVQRARVMDQTPFDRFLMDGEITLAQHQACEYILNQALMAGLFVTGINLNRAGGRRHGSSTPPDMVERYGRTIKIISDRLGALGEYIVQETVLHGADFSKNANHMAILKEGLDLIVQYRLSGGRSPVRFLKRGG